MDPSTPPFSQRGLQALRAAGWREDRIFERSEIEPILTRFGHVLHPAAADFLRRYVWLTWVRTSPYRSDPLMASTDVEEAAARISRGEVAALEPKAGAALCPIGMCGYAEFVVLMDANGRVYGVHWQHAELIEWEESGERWLETLRVPA